MKIISDLKQWRLIRRDLERLSIGFVPTMGNLHEGHLSLLKRSISENDVTVISCFINPTQFNRTSDFALYPRTMEQDQMQAEAAGADYFLMPTEESIYPNGYHYKVTEDDLSGLMEGEFRPGHFDGMLTVVLKLFLLVKANRAYFGEKDFQQLQLVRGMVEEFFIDTAIVACPTVRDNFKLALSSRNTRFSEAELTLAREFPHYLHSDLSCEEIVVLLEEKGFRVDYVEEHQGRRFGAVYLGDVRLIDNIQVKKT